MACIKSCSSSTKRSRGIPGLTLSGNDTPNLETRKTQFCALGGRLVTSQFIPAELKSNIHLTSTPAIRTSAAPYANTLPFRLLVPTASGSVCCSSTLCNLDQISQNPHIVEAIRGSRFSHVLGTLSSKDANAFSDGVHLHGRERRLSEQAQMLHVISRACFLF